MRRYNSKRFWQRPIHIIETAYSLQKVDAVDSTDDSVEHKEVEISKKIVQLLFLKMKPNMMMKMPSTAMMKHNYQQEFNMISLTTAIASTTMGIYFAKSQLDMKLFKS